MADVPGTQPIVNGNTIVVEGLVVQDQLGNLAPQMAVRVDGQLAGAGYPFPVVDLLAIASNGSIVAELNTMEITLTAIAGSGSSAVTALGQVESTLASALAQLAAIDAALTGTLNVSTASRVTNSVASTPVVVGAASAIIAPAGTMTRGWTVQNTTAGGTGYVDLCWGATAVLGSGFYRLFAGSNQASGGSLPPPGTPMSAIASAAGQTIVVTVFN